MKKLLSTMLLVLFAAWATAQQVTIFQENFDGTIQMTSAGTPGWTVDNTLWVSSPNSMNGKYGTGTSSTLVTTPVLDFSGNQFVFLEFKHIAKISFFDQGVIDFSTNGGATWDSVTSFNSDYQGPSTNWDVTNNFTAASYPLIWLPGNDQAVPNNTWWKQERFELPQLGNQANCLIRFRVSDLDGNGMNGANGWNVEDINIVAANCELDPPVINLHPTFSSMCTPNAQFWVGCTYGNVGPFEFSIGIDDAQSGVAFADLHYQVNSNGWLTESMLQCLDSDWVAILSPVVTVGDTICWYVTATDASTCANVATSPTTCFVICPPPAAPICDNFDGGGLVWTPTTNGASNWELGFPGFGLTNSPFSLPNAWDIDIATGYTDNAICDLTSPPIHFDTIFNSTVHFMINYNTDQGGDGMSFQWRSTANPTWTTLGSINCNSPDDCFNWYNTTLFSGGDAWSGTSNGWTPVNHTLNIPGLGGDPAVEFRFHFTSDGFNNVDGFSIDDFCITVPPPNDIGVSAILSPPANSSENATLPICVEVENFGSATQSNFLVTATWNGNVYTVTYTDSLVGGATGTICFIDSFTVQSGPNFPLCAYTSLPDTVPGNDTNCVTVFGVPTIAIPYCDDFESGNVGWTVDATQGSAGNDWELGPPNYQATTGAHSPVNAWDVNLNASYTNGALSYLISPFFDFLGQDSIRLSFWENWSTETFWDGTRLEYDAGSGWNILGAVADPPSIATNWYTNQINSSGQDAWAGNSGGWVNCKYKLIAVPALNNGGTARFRFVFTSDASVLVDGVSVDDFCLKAPCFFDVGITSIVQPVTNSPAGTILPVEITVLNDGTTPLDSILVTYVIDSVGGTSVPVSFTWTGPPSPLGPDATTNITLPGFQVPSGAFTLCIYTALPLDCDANNDTMCIDLVGIPTLNITYCDDFESGNVGWSSVITTGFDPNTDWEFGTPAFGATTGAHSGVNAWDVNLASGYGNQASTQLYTPFFDFSTASGAVLSFWQNYNTDQGADGVMMEYSADNGNTWNILGSATPNPDATNWYNTASLNFTGFPAWSGNNGGWEKSTYFLCHIPDLNNTVDKVQFRWTFTSDFFQNQTNDGYSIDDFCVIQPTGGDLGVNAITAPAGSVPAGNPLSVTLNLHNYGTTVVTTDTLVCLVNGAIVSSLPPFPWSGSISPCADQVILLPGTFNAPSGQYSLCCYSDWIADQDHNNDTTCIDLIGIPTYVLDYSHWFTDNFDTINMGWSPENDPANTNQGSHWEWGAPGNGAPQTPHSPPNVWDVNLNSPYTNGVLPGIYLYSPFFDLTNAIDGIIRFWMNYDDENVWDGVRLEYSLDTTSSTNPTWNILGVVTPNPVGTLNWYQSVLNSSNLPGWTGLTGSTPLTTNWVLSEYPMGNEPGINNAPLIRFRFVFTSDASVIHDGHAIDDFQIEIPVPLDIMPQNLDVVNGNNLLFTGQNVDFHCLIKNRGTATVTQSTATLYVDGFTNVVSTVIQAQTIVKNDSIDCPFLTPWVAIPGVHDFCVVTSLPNGQQDLNTANDTTCFTVVVFDSVVAYPYCNDFESGPQWVTLESETYDWQNSWQLGQPSQAVLNSTHSGANAWTLDLSQNYKEHDQSSLFSPVFTVSSNKCYKLTFWHQFKTERYEDGGACEYSLDHGATWKNIDFTGTPNSSPFNYTYVTALGWTAPGPIKGWTGTSSGWLYGEKLLRPNVNGKMIIRWKFAADFDSTQEGWTIDDVCLNDMGFCAPIGIEELNGHGFELAQNHPNPFNSMTIFDFTLPEDGLTRLYISNIMGQTVAVPVQDNLQAGRYSLEFDAGNLAAGIYYYTLEYKDQKVTKKMVITR